MFLDVLVLARAEKLEQLRILLRKTGDHVVEGARHENLIRFGEAHHALGIVNAVAKRILLTAQVFQHLDRTQIDTDASGKWRLDSVHVGHTVAQIERREQSLLGVAEKT